MTNFGATVKGRVQCMIVDSRTKRVKKTFPMQDNLILNQGLNNYLNLTYSSIINAFSYAVAGTGTTATKALSGATNASQSGTTVTLSGGSFTFTNTATDAGKTIKWGSGEEALIVTVTNPTTVVVAQSQTVASGSFTVYNTQQTGLTTETKRSNTYVNGSCSTTYIAPATLRHIRVFDFTAEVGSVTYTEIGMSHVATVASNLFMRVLLDTPASLISGDQLRVVYQLTISYTPSAPRSKTADVPGWPVLPATNTDITEGFDNIKFAYIDTAGNVVPTNLCLDPGLMSGTYLALSSRTDAITATPADHLTPLVFTSSGLLVTKTYSSGLWETYTSNSFERYLAFVVTTSDYAGTNIRTLYLGFNSGSPTFIYYSYYRILFAQNQTKDNLHKWTVRFRFTISRTLS